MAEPLMEELYSPWGDRRRRVGELRQRYPFAAEILRLYCALLDLQERTFLAARRCPPLPEQLPDWVAEGVLTEIVTVTMTHGPSSLGEEVEAYRDAPAESAALLARWLAQPDACTAVECYLARAALSPILEASSVLARTMSRGEADARHCPVCGGLPQLAYFALSGEDLVTGPRNLLCSRCSAVWQFPRMTCAACGEQGASRLTMFGEAELFPHVRIDACDSCSSYLLTFDLRKDARCVPSVDELAAVPLDLYASDKGLTKITPNLMGM
jgi:formate dehydrogenase maturation protein FdhE